MLTDWNLQILPDNLNSNKRYLFKVEIHFGRSYSHRGFSPVSGRRSMTGNRLNGFQY